MSKVSIHLPPSYCEYAKGSCDQSFDKTPQYQTLFLYPSDPPQISSIIEAAVEKLREADPKKSWKTWKDLNMPGQIIYCTICKAMRFSNHIITDVTTLNFNLMFEIGYALGLELHVIPIRDTSFIRDKDDFDKLALLDTIGYIDFRNSDEITEQVLTKISTLPIPAPPIQLNFQSPLYVIKGPLDTEGEVKLLSTLKKSNLKFRTFDVIEMPRPSLHEVRRQIGNSFGVIAHLLGPHREGAKLHNARCALIAGIAMASGKAVLLLQDENIPQPIDYRDTVLTYTTYSQIPNLISNFIAQGFEWLQDKREVLVKPPKGLLQELDIGDVAAENEIRPLRSYFVETGQYYNAKQGHARLVIGRKGSGKTAIFYAVRDSFGKGISRLMLDLKPEGHQFTRLRDAVLSRLNPGMQEHTLTAFWTLILLSELAHKISTDEKERIRYNSELQRKINIVDEIYKRSGFAEQGDFSERLLNQVNRFIHKAEKSGENIGSNEMTELLFKNEIKELSLALADYLGHKEEVCLLIDNLDKGWPVRGAKREDIMIIRTLLEATRKIQRDLEKRNVDFHCLVFLRNDIYDNLIIETPDRGKDTAILLDMTDPEFYRNLYRLRVITTDLVKGSFEEVWQAVFPPVIGTMNSFLYIFDLTLKRPRDFLNFIHRSIETAINRGHEKITQDDLLEAERIYSQDMLKSIGFELNDVYPQAHNVLYGFDGCNVKLSKTEVLVAILESGITQEELDQAMQLLVWFGFLGVQSFGNDQVNYAYDLNYDLTKILLPIGKEQARFVIHPAFRLALQCIQNI